MTLGCMRVIRVLESVALSDVVLTIGNFDGVHRGHQAILAAGRKLADEGDTQLVAMTFEPHPLDVLKPGHAPPSLSPIDEKLHWFERARVDLAVVAESRPALFGMSAEAFIADVIAARFRPKVVVEGASFAFGRNRQGDVRLLSEESTKYGFLVEVVEPVHITLGNQPDRAISSSLIRQLLQSGKVDQAGLCLGRPYTLLGRVECGAGRGVALGFPTANIRVLNQLIPAQGVYAGRVWIEDKSFTAAVSIGRNATFDGKNTIVEAHLLDFNGNLYDQPIRLELVIMIRQQKQFDSPQSLSEQIGRDVDQIRAIVADDDGTKGSR